MGQQLLKVRLRILLNDITLLISLAIDSTITARGIETLSAFVESVSKIGPCSIQLMTHARCILSSVIDLVAIDVIVEVRPNLGEVLGGVVV